MPKAKKLKDSVVEILMMHHLSELGIAFEREYRFHPHRLWRFDFSVLPRNQYARAIAIEIDGGVWIKGRHTRGKGFENDCRKQLSAIELGWTVLHFTPQMVLTGEAKEWLGKLIGQKRDRLVVKFGPAIPNQGEKMPGSGNSGTQAI